MNTSRASPVFRGHEFDQLLQQGGEQALLDQRLELLARHLADALPVGAEHRAEVLRQFDADQEALATELAAIFEARPLAEWLELFDAEDVCVGPVATIAEAAADLA